MSIVNSVSDLVKKIGLSNDEKFSIDAEPFDRIYREVYNQLMFGEKGVLLVGNVGCGKSLMMQIYQRVLKDTNRKFRSVDASTLREMLEEGATIAEIKTLYGRNLTMDLYIDEVGANLALNKFGNWFNVISELIYDRYNLYVSTGIRTHLSTNLPPCSKNDKIETLSSTLGERVYDRIVQMCSMYSWQINSQRS